jgi:hypothetical protein
MRTGGFYVDGIRMAQVVQHDDQSIELIHEAMALPSATFADWASFAAAARRGKGLEPAEVRWD